MLFRLADRLRAHVDGQKAFQSWEVEMGCIESFALHMRVLSEFIWGDPNPKRFPEDARAADFFPAGQWEELRGRVQRSQLKGLADRAGHEIAHLSYKRTQTPAASRDWKFDLMAAVIGRAFRLFLENVSPNHVIDDFEERVRSTWPEYLNFPVAVGFPPDQNPRSVATTRLPGPVDPASFEELL
jgi:hypothetical protein